jgi:CO/xanthine dehydrogenase Mo-binding subunit
MKLAFRITQSPVSRPDLPASLAVNPQRGQWLSWSGEGYVEVRSGKVEIGQGILTALAQIAAHELRLPIDRIRMIPATTGLSPDEAVTSGSLSIQESGTAIRIVCAELRTRLVARAAAQLGVSPELCDARAGAVHERASERRIEYAALDPVSLLEGEVAAVESGSHNAATCDQTSPLGRSIPRFDLPAKLRGAPSYVHDIRLPDMLHARVLRASIPGATLLGFDESVLDRFGMRVRVLRDGNFLAVTSEREWLAIRGAALLEPTLRWEQPELPFDDASVADWLPAQPADTKVIAERPDPAAHRPAPTLEATYSKPFIAHASLMPSCAVARWQHAHLEVWSHTQGPYNLRADLALVFPEADITVHHAEGAGCYGHNGADDVALDAALIARHTGVPVRVLWSRRDEMIRSPMGSAMTMRLRAWLDGNRITRWEHEVWSAGHSLRPGRAPTPTLLAATEIDSHRFEPRESVNAALAAGGGSERNAIPAYTFDALRVTNHRIRSMPLRTSALRSLGAFGNVFAIESMMDDLAALAKLDQIEFRLAHLTEPRARRVLETLAEEMSPGARTSTDSDALQGTGIGFAHYKNLGAWCAVAANIAVSDRIIVKRLTVVADVGNVINPDGARNQLEGGALQACSWTLMESIRIDRHTGPTTVDWSTYPILSFSDQPEVRAVLVDADGAPPLGAGECAHGPTAAAIANALNNVMGIRVHALPLLPERIRQAIEAA